MKKIALVILFYSLIFVSGAPATELSADVIMKSSNGESTSKMYMKTGKFRADPQNQAGYHIIRQDRKVMWIVLPESKAYMEIRYNQETKIPEDKMIPGEVDRKNIGSEIIDGHPTVKYEITYEDNHRIKKIFQWMAVDINFPVKVSAIDGSWSNEYKNINIGHVPDTLFEVPAGYERMSIPETKI